MDANRVYFAERVHPGTATDTVRQFTMDDGTVITFTVAAGRIVVRIKGASDNCEMRYNVLNSEFKRDEGVYKYWLDGGQMLIFEDIDRAGAEATAVFGSGARNKYGYVVTWWDRQVEQYVERKKVAI